MAAWILNNVTLASAWTRGRVPMCHLGSYSTRKLPLVFSLHRTERRVLSCLWFGCSLTPPKVSFTTSGGVTRIPAEDLHLELLWPHKRQRRPDTVIDTVSVLSLRLKSLMSHSHNLFSTCVTSGNQLLCLCEIRDAIPCTHSHRERKSDCQTFYLKLI